MVDVITRMHCSRAVTIHSYPSWYSKVLLSPWHNIVVRNALLPLTSSDVRVQVHLKMINAEQVRNVLVLCFDHIFGCDFHLRATPDLAALGCPAPLREPLAASLL